MGDWHLVPLKAGAMFLVMLLGWAVRRGGLWTEDTTARVSRLVVDVTFPALVFSQMLRTVDAQTLRTGWAIPLLGIGIIVLGELVGLACAPWVRREEQRRTFVFLVAIPNWVYLPLPIVAALHGAEGVRCVLLFNVGAQVLLWTMGVWTLRRGVSARESLGHIVTNPGLIATAAGVLAALAWPGARTRGAAVEPGGSPLALGAVALLDAVTMVGELTIALSLLVTGAQMGARSLREHRPSGAVWGALAARLVIVPAAVAALLEGLAAAGLVLPAIPRHVAYLIAAMPSAVSSSIFTERYGGDTVLSARTIFYGTLGSLASVPAFYYVVVRLGG